MRVVLLMDSLFTGGAEFSSLQLFGWLKQRGHEVQVVTLKAATPSYDPKQFGLDIVDLKGSFLEKFRHLNKLLSRFKPDIVHSVLFSANMLGRIARIYRRDYVHVESLVNEMYGEHRLADPQVTKIKLLGYRLVDWVSQIGGVDHFHANSESVSKHYQKKLHVHGDRITIIPRGRLANPHIGNQEVRLRIRQEFDCIDQLVLVNVGRHEYQKGQDVLLDALARLSTVNENWIMLIVGREGKLTNKLRGQIDQYKLAKHVKLVGHRVDVPEILAATDVFVFPSRFEGLPGALIEAEAAGLPIVASDISSNKEVANSSNARFVEVNNAEALTYALKEVVENASVRSVMSSSSKQIFEERFQLEKIHLRMEEFYSILRKMRL